MGAFAELCEEKYPGETVVLCSHGGPVVGCFEFLMQAEDSSELACGYTAIFVLVKEEGRWRGLVKGSTDHLHENEDLGLATAGKAA
eukprot:gene7692-biopygen7772